MTASLMFSAQLFMVGAITGGCLDMISFVRTLIFANNSKKWASSPLWLVGFICVMIATGIMTWENAWSILPIMGSILSTVALWMKKEKDLGAFKRFVLPSLALLSCVFMVFAAVYAHGITPYLKAKEAGAGFTFPVLFYFIVFAVIMIAGAFFKKKNK